MAITSRKKSQKPPHGSRVAALVVFVLIFAAVAGYFLFSPSKNVDKTAQNHDFSHYKPAVPGAAIPNGVTIEPPAVSQHPPKKQSDYPQPAVIPETEKPGTVIRSSGRLAIIIDDMGSSLSEAHALAAIKVPLTFAIIPGLLVDKDIAAYAASQKIETMIHIPMQPKGWPAHRLEANGLLVSMDDEELQERVSAFIARFPGAVGANNHMGSEFTEQEEKMTAVLLLVKKHNLFFIDSVTSPASVGLRTAERLGIRSSRRNVFLDNEQERGYILGQLAQAVRIARKSGTAIAICHPHSATIAVLSAALPGLAGQGVLLVPVSQLVNL